MPPPRQDPPPGLSRRTLLCRAAAATIAAAVGDLSMLERDVAAQSVDADPSLTRDTINGLVAFVVPGPDAYSRAQGEWTLEPGGIDAGATDALIETLDRVSPPLRVSTATAALLNRTALEVAPIPAHTEFPSPFARLSFAEKVEVFRRLAAETSSSDSPLGRVTDLLPAAVAGTVYGEAPVFDAARRTVRQRPVGWDLANYPGPADGRPALVGFYERRRRVATSPRYARRRRRRGRGS